jgi:hypothetical protein
MMACTAHTHGYLSVKEKMFPLLPALVSDEEYMLRQHLAEQLRDIADVCVKDGAEDGYRSVIDKLLPYIARLVADSQAEVCVQRHRNIYSTHVPGGRAHDCIFLCLCECWCRSG